jgi:hypothetical protein
MKHSIGYILLIVLVTGSFSCDRYDRYKDPDAVVSFSGAGFTGDKMSIQRQYSLYSLIGGNYTRCIFQGKVINQNVTLELFLKGTEQLSAPKGTLIWSAYNGLTHYAQVQVGDSTLYESVAQSGYTAINTYDSQSTGSRINGSFEGYLLNKKNPQDTLRVSCNSFQSTLE